MSDDAPTALEHAAQAAVNDPGVIARATPYYDMATSAVRAAALVGGAVVATAGYVSKHDWAGLIDYVQGQPFTLAFATVAGASAFLWGQWNAHTRARELAAIAASPKVPDEVAKLKG